MRKFIAISLLLMTSAVAYSQARNGYVISGNRFYNEKKYDKALPEYQKAKETNAGDAVTSYNLGNAYFRNNNFDDAIKNFEQSIENSTNDGLKQSGYYNKGVSFSKQSKLEESIDAYKTAVKMNPSDNDARINLQKALLELKKRMPPPPEKKEDKKKRPQEKKPKNRESKMSKKEVEQRLKALQEREQQVQRKMQERNRTAGQQEKDW